MISRGVTIFPSMMGDFTNLHESGRLAFLLCLLGVDLSFEQNTVVGSGL